MEDLNEIAKDTAEHAIQFAAQNGITLDYTRESAGCIDLILESYHEQLDEYDGDEGAKTLWNAAVLYGIYVGEVLLRSGLAERGFVWVEDDGLPLLVMPDPDNRMEVSPITKAHKRILNGAEDGIASFVDVVFSVVVDGEMPKEGVLRVPDVELASGEKIEKIVFQEAEHFLSLVAEGKEDFVIFTSHDGFFQFYGVGDQFICEVWFNLDGRRAYGMINPDCANTERVNLVTPYGKFTPRERDILSLEQLRLAMREYFYNLEEADFLAKVPHEKIEI